MEDEIRRRSKKHLLDFMVKMGEQPILVQMFSFQLYLVQQCAVVCCYLSVGHPRLLQLLPGHSGISLKPEPTFSLSLTLTAPSSVLSHQLFSPRHGFTKICCVCVCISWTCTSGYLCVCVCVPLPLFVWPLGFGCHRIINHQA